MPPKKIDVPAKGVDSAIWLRHWHYCLALSVLKCCVPEGEMLALFVFISSDWLVEGEARRIELYLSQPKDTATVKFCVLALSGCNTVRITEFKITCDSKFRWSSIIKNRFHMIFRILTFIAAASWWNGFHSLVSLYLDKEHGMHLTTYCPASNNHRIFTNWAWLLWCPCQSNVWSYQESWWRLGSAPSSCACRQQWSESPHARIATIAPGFKIDSYNFPNVYQTNLWYPRVLDLV